MACKIKMLFSSTCLSISHWSAQLCSNWLAFDPITRNTSGLILEGGPECGVLSLLMSLLVFCSQCPLCWTEFYLCLYVLTLPVPPWSPSRSPMCESKLEHGPQGSEAWGISSFSSQSCRIPGTGHIGSWKTCIKITQGLKTQLKTSCKTHTHTLQVGCKVKTLDQNIPAIWLINS